MPYLVLSNVLGMVFVHSPTNISIGFACDNQGRETRWLKTVDVQQSAKMYF